MILKHNLTSGAFRRLLIVSILGLFCNLFFVHSELLAEQTSESTSRLSFNENHPLSIFIINLSINESYDQALMLLDSLDSEFPENPFVYLLQATILSTRSTDYEDQVDLPALDEVLDRVESACKSTFPEPDSSAQFNMYMGMSELYRILVEKPRGKWMTMTKHAMQAQKYFETAISIDSSFYDAYYGLGVYKYHFSQKAGLLKSLGLVKDRSQEGIENLRLAAEHGKFTQYTARNSMAWIEMNKERHDEAVRIATDLSGKFPGTRIFLWTLGKALIKAERWEESIPVFTKLLTAIELQTRNNRYNEITCLYYLSKACFNTAQYDEVQEYTERALNIKPSKKVRKSKKDDLAEMEKLKQKSLERIEKTSP